MSTPNIPNFLLYVKTYYDLCETNVDIRGEIHLKLNNETNAIGRVSLSENSNSS